MWLADAQAEMGKFPGLQYCKTDLMAEKGIVFCKFSRASQALAVLETIGALGTVRACAQILVILEILEDGAC